MKNIKTSPYIPTDITIQESGKNGIKIVAYPFEAGYAVTLAHPLRRLLLGSSVGFAPIALKIEGATHEFDSVRGLMEDVAIFIVNLKNIRFKIKGDAQKLILDYSFAGNRVITGADLATDEVSIVTPDFHLATINQDAELKFSIILHRGLGYLPSEDVRALIPDNYIPLDAYFTPVRKATYEIENVLVEDNPTFEKIVFEIETDGLIDPLSAFKNSLAVMYKQMSVFNTELNVSAPEVQQKEEEIPELKHLLQKAESLNLSARSFNCVDRSNIKYVGELVLMNENELKEIKNLGKKSYEEIRDKLEEIGYPVGKDIPEALASALRKKLEKLK